MAAKVTFGTRARLSTYFRGRADYYLLNEQRDLTGI
jgi:hypothetical protein